MLYLILFYFSLGALLYCFILKLFKLRSYLSGELGDLQTKSLENQGADPFIGVRLSFLFNQAGINLVETGILEKNETGTWDSNAWELEWEVIESDLKGDLPPSELASLKIIDLESRLSGKRILYVPTHFAWGRV